MNFGLNTRNCVSKNEEFCIQNDEFCSSYQAIVNEELTFMGLLTELDEAISEPPFSIKRDLVPSGAIFH